MGLAASPAFALIAPHLWLAWLALTVFAVLCGTALDEQHKVFRLYWPLASAHSFQPLTMAL